MRNVGIIDRILRFALGSFLLWLGLFYAGGLEGELVGLAISMCSLMPLYMAITGSCFVFRWFRVHSLSASECSKYGDPYP